MSIKLAILHEAIDRCQLMIKANEELLSTNWIGKVCKLRIEAQKLLKKNHLDDSKQTKEVTKKLSALAKQEKIYLEKANLLNNAMKDGKIFKELSKLHLDLDSLQRELYLEQHKQKRFPE